MYRYIERIPSVVHCGKSQGMDDASTNFALASSRVWPFSRFFRSFFVPCCLASLPIPLSISLQIQRPPTFKQRRIGIHYFPLNFKASVCVALFLDRTLKCVPGVLSWIRLFFFFYIFLTVCSDVLQTSFYFIVSSR